MTVSSFLLVVIRTGPSKPLEKVAENALMRYADASAGSTVTTESISYATSTERTTIVSSYIGTATETTTASGPTQTVSGPTQTLLGPTQTELGPTQTISGPTQTVSGPTQTASGPTQTVSGPTQTQVITTSYVETYIPSYPVTETLPGELHWPLCSSIFFLGEHAALPTAPKCFCHSICCSGDTCPCNRS